jgi:hypothetical protein
MPIDVKALLAASRARVQSQRIEARARRELQSAQRASRFSPVREVIEALVSLQTSFLTNVPFYGSSDAPRVASHDGQRLTPMPPIASTVASYTFYYDWHKKCVLHVESDTLELSMILVEENLSATKESKSLCRDANEMIDRILELVATYSIEDPPQENSPDRQV